MENTYVFTFHSTHQALEFEKLLNNNDYKVKLIPVPRQISSSCGLAGRIKKNDINKLKSLCNKNNIEYDSIYELDSGQKNPVKVD
ncbi:MAG: DUF3343 domain-containing protein [Halanaerobiales bacterium]